MATYTASSAQAGIQPKKIHAGVIAESFTYNSSATSVASGDVILLALIPDKATILDIQISHSTGATAYTMDYGITGSASLISSSAAQATNNRAGKIGALPYKISLSDDAVTKYVYLTASSTTSTATTSLVIAGNVYYTMDSNL